MPSPTTLDDLHQMSAYKELRQTFATGASPIVAMVGAGLSRAAGVPSWSELKNALLQELRDKASRQESTADATRLAFEATTIQNDTNFWVSFSRLKHLLGHTTYQSQIRAALQSAESATIPPVYEALWRNPVQGVLTLNLDSFARRAFSSTRPGVEVKHFIGKDAARLQHLLHTRHPFSFSLHGTLDDVASWVFTHEDLQTLYKGAGYRQLLTTIYSTYTVLFLGVSANDVAVGGPLKEMVDSGIEGRTHYWLTDRTAPATEMWAEQAGIRLLPYRATDDDHSIVLSVLHDLRNATPVEVIAPPVVYNLSTHSELPDPETLASQPVEQIRNVLNSRARELLGTADGEAEFDRFLERYDEAVHRAWYVGPVGQPARIFGNELHELVAKGAFGRVYRATAPDGSPIALKMLLGEIRQDPELLKSFRRGVRAMKLLEAHQVKSMVAYREASEIPAFVTMEWIDGPNLSQAKDARFLEDWDSVLWVASNLIDAIKQAHDLPERVLHRDIRPANVMLRNGWLDPSEWELVVLDFDLSTFRGARQKSVLAEGSALGFLAPEQLDEHARSSTRNAAVDSFGIGMTLLFLCSGEEPEAYSQRRGDYQALVLSAVRRLPEGNWRSLPRRLARLVIEATRDEQHLRPDIAQLQREVRRLQAANHGTRPASLGTDFVCEELAARCPSIATVYEWDINRDGVVVDRPGGLSLRLNGAPEARATELALSWSATGVEDRANVSKYLPERVDRAVAALRRGPWTVSRASTERHAAMIMAAFDTAQSGDRLDEAADALDRAVRALGFADIY